MAGQTEMSGNRLARRLITFYAILAVIGVAVVVFVVSKGGNEKAQPSIAGGYALAAPSPCIGPVPKPAGGIPLPSTAPTQVAAAGPSFNVLQSGQFVNFTNNQNTLGGQLRLDAKTLPGNSHQLTGTVNCVSGGGSLKLNAIATPGAKAAIVGTLGGRSFVANFKTAPPAPGASAPRTPTNIQGTYTVSPGSTCFGSSFSIHGTGSVATLYSSAGKNLGPVTYSTKTAGVFGDVKCVRGGIARMTATANDLQLQNVTVIPLNVAKPVAATATLAKPALTTPSGLSPAGEKFTATKQRSDFNKLVAAVFLSIAIVLIVCRIFGYIATKVGEPRVMGEVIAGLVLGPSLLGAISPNLQAMFFPSDVLSALGVVANLGLIFYMFLVGLEVDRGQLKGKVAPAAAISNASVAVPLLLGIAIALPLYKLIGPDKKFVAFALFMGVAMSITAFPVLARILAERRMLKRPVGALTIACAAIDDVTAWFLIALATTIAVSGTFGDVLKTIAEAAVYIAIMILIVRRVVARMAIAFDEVGRIPGAWFAGIIVGVLLSAYVTEEINIAFIFGAFVMGMVMPRHARLSEEITRRIDDFVVTLLLPVFFVYTGLRTNVGLLDRPELWLLTLVLIAVAILGKLAGAAIAARVAGYDWKASAVIGTLMNTRGLTELIVLNLALDVGAITPTLFAMLVIMAVVTTLMAGPLLKLLDPEEPLWHRRRGRVRRRRARRGPGSPRAAGARALDPRGSRDRRRDRATGRTGRAPRPLRAAARVDRRPPSPATARRRRRRARRPAVREPPAGAGLPPDQRSARAASQRGRRGPRCRADLDESRIRSRSHRRARTRRSRADRRPPPPDRRGGAARRRNRAARARGVRRCGTGRQGGRSGRARPRCPGAGAVWRR